MVSPSLVWRPGWWQAPPPQTDIFVLQVRETGELELEEELYAKLIFLYRSPETLIKWTRR